MNVRELLLVGAVALVGLATGSRLGTGTWPDADLLRRLAAGEPPVQAAASPSPAIAERKVRYYRNPMGLADTSPVPKKDWMGMDYIAVYEGEEVDDGKTVTISLDRVQRAGVRSAAAATRRLVRPVRAAGKVALDESRLRIVTLRFDGFIEKLHADTTGQTVRKGEPLFRVFSQEVLNALANYRVSMIAAGKKSGREVDGAVQRLANLEVSREQINRIGTRGDIPDAIEWPSPVSGTIMEKMVIEGERAEAGRALFKIADLSRVWVLAEIAEQDLGLIRVGAKASVTFMAMPGETITGEVAFIYPDLGKETRTGRIRIELPNPDGKLMPDMYADVVIDAGSGEGLLLAVPVEAIIDSGSRQIVLLDKGQGRFEPREVRLGRRGDGYIEVTHGLVAGEMVVTTANFLIDAESNLKAALKTFTGEPAVAAGDAVTPGTAAAEVTP